MNDKNANVCPSCGNEPWDFMGEFEDNPKDRKREVQPKFCSECGDKLIPRSELPKDIWKDPYVKEALKEGRDDWDIAVMRCPECGQFGYYNEGSSFSCRFGCGSWRVDEEMACDAVSLSDTITETTEGYHNQTL